MSRRRIIHPGAEELHDGGVFRGENEPRLEKDLGGDVGEFHGLEGGASLANLQSASVILAARDLAASIVFMSSEVQNPSDSM